MQALGFGGPLPRGFQLPFNLFPPLSLVFSLGTHSLLLKMLTPPRKWGSFPSVAYEPFFFLIFNKAGN